MTDMEPAAGSDCVLHGIRHSAQSPASRNGGKLTVRSLGEPIRVSACQCLACPQRTGSVFAAQARLCAGDVVIGVQAREWCAAATLHGCGLTARSGLA